ncbi:MAG: dUTP diphosphatase [Candidatus Spechtbacterales bacterium]
MIKIYINKIDPSAKLPSYAYKGDAGMDLFSFEDVKIPSFEKVVISTGLKVAIPAGYAGFIWDKSGLAVKNNVTTLAGLIDSNYRGELKVVLMNLGKKEHVVKKGDKIAQLIVKPVEEVNIEEADDIDTIDEAPTERGAGGFGSSGVR